MLTASFRLCVLLVLIAGVSLNVLGQTRPRPKPRATPIPDLPKPEDMDKPPPETPDKDVDTIKTDTDLVTVPVIATDRGGLYIPDLTQPEFNIVEDGVKQEIAFFAQVSAPFHVVLMLDTSASTQEKLSVIQQAAYSFVRELQSVDRVKIISFDDTVRDLNEFTSDRNVLKEAINKTKSGQGTRVYDAMTTAFNSLRPIKGRKAIVIFTDGVDWHSDEATFKGTIRWLDEEGVIVYPIRYDTRAATERIARQQSEEISPTLPTIDVMRAPTGTTPKTFPSDDPVPTIGTNSKTGPLGLPSASEILRRRREQERTRDPSSDPSVDPDRYPGPNDPSTDPRRNPDPRTTNPIPGGADARYPSGTVRRSPRPDDSITATLDAAYSTADSYLKALAERSGGRLVRADTLVSLPDAFAEIAAELRTQYSLGYYPINKERDDHYRKIKVSTTRKDVVIRARPGYLATNAQ